MRASHILLWSGGFDSTAILLDMVAKPAQYPTVRVVSCELKNAANHAEDAKAKKAIIEILKLDKNLRFELIESTDFNIVAQGGGQAPIWALLTAMNVSSRDASTVELCYGYIRGDDFWHFRPEFESAARSIAKIAAPEINVKFTYPLEWLTKKEFTSWYMNYPDVFDHLSWGGDTVAAKLKEKDELEFLFRELRAATQHMTTAEPPDDPFEGKGIYVPSQT